MKITKDITIEEVDRVVLEYLEKYKKANPESFTRLLLYGAGAGTILKYLRNNEVAANWKEGHLDDL